MNRAICHDALLAWRETAAALTGWGDRILVIVGVALIFAGARHEAAGASTLSIRTAALLFGAWIGFGVGRLVERRLAYHRDHYLFAEAVLPRAGGWQYRSSAMAVLVIVAVGVTAGIDARGFVPIVVGLTFAFLTATAGDVLTVRPIGVRRIATSRLRHLPGVIFVLAVATLPLWWPAAPTWVIVIPVLAIAAITAPNDAGAVRFEAIVGRPVGATAGTVLPMVLWSAAVALAAFADGVGAGAVGLVTSVAVVWFATLRMMAWRWVGRRSGELIVLAVVAGNAIVGTMAVVLVPVALAIGTAWLWRRSQAATWLIA